MYAEEEKRCPVCGKKITGRTDKIFCCDDCRIFYNNKKNREKLLKNFSGHLLKNTIANCTFLAGSNAKFLLKIIWLISVICKIMTTFVSQIKKQ